MSFTEPSYYIFLTVAVLLLCWRRTQKFRLELLIVLSLTFYATFSVINVGILCSVVGVTYVGAIALERLKGESGQGFVLFLLIILVSAPLILFKYAKDIPSLGHIVPTGIAFPIGVSFYTFLAIGYLVDVHLGLQPAVRKLARFVAFITFFPSVTAGPIERSHHLLPQLDKIGGYRYENIVGGLRAILLGLVLKLAISEAIRPIVDQVYSAPQLYGRADIVVATILFAFQVYADFAGYSLIAIGSAKLLGIDLLKNFTQPFLSTTIPEFWRSWHISLSSWVRDYVFSSLRIQMRSLKMWGFGFAALTSFVAVGLWHGAGIKFLVFGIIHGALVIGSTLTLARRDAFWQRIRLPRKMLICCRIVNTFLLVTATLVLFRAADWTSSLGIYRTVLFSAPSAFTLSYGYALLAVIALLSADIYARQGKGWEFLPRPVRLGVYHSLVIVIFIAYHTSNVFQAASNNQFIYYKF